MNSVQSALPKLPTEIILTPHDPADQEVIVAKTDLSGLKRLFGHYRAVKMLIPGETAERHIYIKIDQLARKLGLTPEVISFMDGEALGKQLKQKYMTSRVSSLIPLQVLTAEQKEMDCNVHFKVSFWKKLKSFLSRGGGYKAVKLNFHDLGVKEVYVEAYVLKKIIGGKHTIADIHTMGAETLGNILTENIHQSILFALTDPNHPNRLIKPMTSSTISPPTPSVVSPEPNLTEPMLVNSTQIKNILISNRVMNEDDLYTDDGLFLAGAINGIVKGQVDLEEFKNLVSRDAQSIKDVLIQVGKQLRDIKKTLRETGKTEIEIPISATQYSFRITPEGAIHIIKR